MSDVAQLIDRLASAGLSVATAESLTGGLLASTITAVPGASRVFRGGVVAYASEVKESVLGVPHEVLEHHGAVSAECAGAMAGGIRRLLAASYGISTTGVAGPSLQEGHPPGTVWIAVAGPGAVSTRLLDLEGGREEIREATCQEAMTLLAGILRREEPGLG